MMRRDGRLDGYVVLTFPFFTLQDLNWFRISFDQSLMLLGLAWDFLFIHLSYLHFNDILH